MKKQLLILALLWLLAAVPYLALAHDASEPVTPEEQVVAILGLFAILLAAVVPLPKRRARRRERQDAQPPQDTTPPPE